jgi:hypothetical protein
MYTALSGDTAFRTNAVRTLNWATYTVAADGRNRYIRDDIWLTDGYGDYVRHYLRAMAVLPELAPAENHLLASSSVVKLVSYNKDKVTFTTFDDYSDVTIRLIAKPLSVTADGKSLTESRESCNNYWAWVPLTRGGYVRLRYSGAKSVTISL